MKAFLILEDGTVFTGTSIGSTRDMISEIVFNTSMTGYLEVLTDPSYAGQAVVMTYPLIGNYGITPDMESLKAWPDGYIVRELSRMPSNFRCEGTIQDFLKKYDIPGIAGVDTRALTKILREKGTMNGMITTNENYDLEEVISKLKNYKVEGVVSKVTCEEKYVLEGTGKKVALLDLGAKKNIAKSLNDRGCEVTVYPADTTAEEIIASNPDGIMLSNGPGDPAECTSIIKEIHTPKCPVYQNVDALPHTDPVEIKKNLVAQLTASVRWTQSVKNMIADGATDFTECGPGAVLQGLIKKIDGTVSAHGIA